MNLPLSVPPAQFSRKRPITTTKISATQNMALLGDRFTLSSTCEDFQMALTNNDIVTSSGQTLSEILSLSHPEDLASYRVESVQKGWRGGLKEVVYSRAESEADLRHCHFFWPNTERDPQFFTPRGPGKLPRRVCTEKIGGLKEVVYSRAENEADLRIGLAQMTQVARTNMADFLRVLMEKAELERWLARWQTADLVVDAFGCFVWASISGVDRGELEQWG